MFILKLCLSAILWSALGAMIAAFIIIGATIFLLCIVVFASRSGAIMPSGKKARLRVRLIGDSKLREPGSTGYLACVIRPSWHERNIWAEPLVAERC